MNFPVSRRPVTLIGIALALSLIAGGCNPLGWFRDGFKVGPNYSPPPASMSPQWSTAADRRFTATPPDPAWWNVFRDPVLCDLIATAARDNLDLKAAAARVLQAQAQRNIAAGNLFPQTQQAEGSSTHAQISPNTNIFSQLTGTPQPPGAPPSIINVSSAGFNASWELDFWGRYRRAIESADAEVGSAIEGTHDVLVILTADVATNYVQIRTYQQRLEYARQNVEAQRGSLRIAEARFKDGTATRLDVTQAQSNLAQTEATIPPLVIGLREANDRLWVLLGRPAADLPPRMNLAGIPAAPPEVAVGIPAGLLERRPDVRRARQEVAAQSARIGVAEADFYPSIGVSGFIGYTSGDITKLFEENSFTSYIMPNFQWKILNYGRIENNVRLEDARLHERVFSYQQTVLNAGRDVEDALAAFVQYQLQVLALERSVLAAAKSVDLVLDQYRDGRSDFNRVFTTQAQLAAQQDQLAAAQGSTALSLIAVYRALGGGWQFFDPEVPGARVARF